DADAAAHDATGNLDARVELDLDRPRRCADRLRSQRPGRKSFALEDDVVGPFLESMVECAVAAGAHDFVFAITLQRHGDAADPAEAAPTRRFHRLDADAGERAAAA